ncbi:MAG: extracellular solute-binding protein [Sulfolobales archaeon]
MSFRSISRTLMVAIIVIIVILAAIGVILIYTPRQPITTTPITTPTTSPSPTLTTPTTTTPTVTMTTTPTPTLTTLTTPTATVQLAKLSIGGVEIRVPQSLYDFAMKAREGKISVTINFWTSMYPFEADLIKQVVANFTREYPGIKINYQNVQNMKETIKAGIVAGDVENTAHVFTWAHDWTGEFAEAGYIIALDKYLPPETLSDIQSQVMPVAFAAGQLGVHVYGLPWAAEAIALICDATKVPQIPSTFSEFESIMKRFTDPSRGLYGLAYQIDPYHIYPFVTAFGGYYYDETSDTTALNSTGTIQGLSFLLTHVFPYMYTADTGSETQLKIFTDKKAPCIITGPWSINAIKSVYTNISIGPIPNIDSRVPRPYVGVKLLWITSLVEQDPNRLYGSLLFVIWFVLNDPTLKLLVDGAGYIPVKNSLIQYIAQHRDIYNIAYGFIESISRGVPMPKVPKMGCVWDPVGTAVSAIVTEYSEKGLDATLKDLRNILDQATSTLVTKCNVKLSKD